MKYLEVEGAGRPEVDGRRRWAQWRGEEDRSGSTLRCSFHPFEWEIKFEARSGGRSPPSVPLVVVAHGCCVTCVCEVFEAGSDFSILG